MWFSISTRKCDFILFTTLYTPLDIFTNQRIVIAVTHFDTTYSLLMPDLRVDRKTVATKVTDDIKAATGVTVPLDIVVTVSGTWALAARQLRNSPDNVELRRGVILALEGCPEIARDEIEGLNQLSSTDLAKKLEIASGITKLEQRLVASSVIRLRYALTMDLCSPGIVLHKLQIKA